MSRARVAVLKTSPETVLDDIRILMGLADYQRFLPKDRDTLIKLNLSWTKYFPSCSSQPWQVEGVVRTLLEDGYSREKLIPVENKTVVTNPTKGARNNKWLPVLEKYGLEFVPLPDVEWMVYPFKSPLLKLNEIFPEGIHDPEDVRRKEHPPPAHGQDARPFDDDGRGEERLRRPAQGSPPLRP